MKIKMAFVVMLFLSVQFLPFQSVVESAMMENNSVRITIIDKGMTYEWEYDNPNKYEYEIGEKVVKGTDAKKEVIRMISLLKLNENAEVEDMLECVQKQYQDIERLDVRMMNAEGQLFTWVWEKAN
ncbi:hypothetical protein [Bacillus alkalicellulosilyticus]|uniref:hypothetical protein n=1 Tax=Alkalihalobacterium alkalicellulosilyticum TaxID=1912214 RepID=UPI00099770A4|nr:hypothetical protein [Bacillus alkalicellulosilyticus]